MEIIALGSSSKCDPRAVHGLSDHVSICREEATLLPLTSGQRESHEQSLDRVGVSDVICLITKILRVAYTPGPSCTEADHLEICAVRCAAAPALGVAAGAGVSRSRGLQEEVQRNQCCY